MLHFWSGMPHMQKPPLIGETEIRLADENEIVIRSAAVAMNNIDIQMQDAPWSISDYPLILGTDVAGEVVKVVSQVPNFGVGDRVLCHALRLATEDDRHAAFQHYTVLMPNMACTIPPTMSYESAAVLPLGVSTAAAGLFQDDTLALEPPRLVFTLRRRTYGSSSWAPQALSAATRFGSLWRLATM